MTDQTHDYCAYCLYDASPVNTTVNGTRTAPDGTRTPLGWSDDDILDAINTAEVITTAWGQDLPLTPITTYHGTRLCMMHLRGAIAEDNHRKIG